MLPDYQTKVVAANLNQRRRVKLLPALLVFEVREQDGSFTTIGSIDGDWCGDEVVGETGGSIPEYQVLIMWRAGIDAWAQECSSVMIGSTRYEKRAVDPSVGSPAVVRLRCQPITGYASF